MLYLFYGDDSAKKNSAVKELGNADALGVFFASEGDSFEDIIKEHAESRSLFGEKSIVIFDNLLANKETRSVVLPHANTLALSENIFVFLEQKAVKEILTAFSKAGATITEFSEKSKKMTEAGLNIFTLTEAFARKDKKESWTILQRAYREGKSPEEVFGILFWQIKNLLLVKEPRATAETLNMKPFVFSKSLSAARQWEKKDLVHAAQMLVAALHTARRGETDVASALEKVILTAF